MYRGAGKRRDIISHRHSQARFCSAGTVLENGVVRYPKRVVAKIEGHLISAVAFNLPKRVYDEDSSGRIPTAIR